MLSRSVISRCRLSTPAGAFKGVSPPFKSTPITAVIKRRFCASGGNPTPPQKSLLVRAAELYTILLGANYISNMLIHPTAKMDYGMLNRFYPDGREVASPFWGTRLPHLFAIPASLTFFDLSVGALFTRYFGLVSFAATPGPWLMNIFCYTWLAVGSFIAWDASLNPAHEGRRVEQVTSHVPMLTGAMGMQWHAQMMLDTFGSTAGGPIALLRNAFALSLVFLPVKALGFGDRGEQGLSPHERKMNGLPPKEK